MAFNKQNEIKKITIFLLTTAFILVPVIATTNDDCKGKAFHCVNSTHFKICVDFGGVSKTVDDFLIQCPPGTGCADSNYFECEYQIPTTSAPLAVQSDVTNELSETTVSSPWEFLEVTTLHPISNNERSIELLENSTIALPEKVSQEAGTEVATTVSDTPINDILNEVITEGDNKTTLSDLSESENNNNDSKPTESILNNNITSPTILDVTNDLSGDNLSANISSAVVTTENYSTTESAISIDLLNTIITTSSNTVKATDFASTKLFNSVVTDSLNLNNLSAAVTIENYSGTESEISIDLYEPVMTTLRNMENADNTLTTLSSPEKTNDFSSLTEVTTENNAIGEKDSSTFLRVITTPSNIIGNEDFTSSTLSHSVKNDSLILKSSLAAVPTEHYSDAESETLVTSSNNKLNAHFTTVTLSSPVTTASLINTQNAEINLTVTSDSYSPNIQQDTTERDDNFLTESATNANEFYTNVVKKTFHDRVDDYPMHENSTHTNMIYEISSSLQNVDSNQMGFLSTTPENLVLRNTLDTSSINEQIELSSPAMSTNSVNAKNIRTFSDIVDSTNSTSLKVENIQQDTTEINFGQTTTEANMLYTNTPNNEENIILNKDDIFTTKLYATINDSHSTAEDIVNSSPDDLTTKSDSYVVDAQKDTAERDINSPTLTTSTKKDVYTTPEESISQVDETTIYENGASILPISDFLSTVGYDESHSMTAITVALKNTEEKISPKEQSNISLEINTSYPLSDKVNNGLLETTTIQSTSAIDFTTNTDSYDEVNLSITSTVNENEFHTNVTKNFLNNTTVEFLRHINSTHKNIIDETTTYLPENTHFTLSAQTENVEVSFETVMNVSLNDTVEELSTKGTSNLLSPVATANASVTDIIVTSLLSDMSNLVISTESYVANTNKHTNVTKVEFPISSKIDVTTQYHPTTQNIETETLTNEFHSTVMKEDYGSTQDFAIQQNGNDNTPSMFPSFPKHNDNLIEPSINVSEPVHAFEVYEQTTNADMDLLKTQASGYSSLRPTKASTETLINNSVKELSRNESNNKMYASPNFTTILTTRTADKEQITDPINGVLTATSVTKSWDTMNDSVQVFLPLNATLKVTVDSEITPGEYQNQPITANYAFDYIITTHSFITDGLEESSDVTKESSAKATLINDNQFLSTIVSVLKSSPFPNDSVNVDVINDIYGSTSPSIAVTENYSYKNYLSENVPESSVSESDNLEIPQIINTTAFAEINKSTIYNMGITKTDKSSNYNIIDELTVSTENILTRPSANVVYSLNSSIDKDRNNITQTLVKNTFGSTERTTPFKSINNSLKAITPPLSESNFSLNSNNTQLDIENKNVIEENVTKLINVTKSDSQITTSKVNVTNEKPVHTAIYRNVNSSTQSQKYILKVTESDINKISANDTTSDIGPPITENNLRTNIGYVNNATISKNISRQHNLSANINMNKEESTIRDSVMSGGLNIEDKVVKSVSLLNHLLQNTLNNMNQSTQFHTNKSIEDFTQQFNNSRYISVENADANSYQNNMKNISFNIPEKKQNQTLKTFNKSIVNFNNVSVNLETMHAQNKSDKIIVTNKTKKDDINALHNNAENKKGLSISMQINEDKRKEQHNITRITPIELHNKNLPNDYESTKSTFNCHSRHRGKYSDKHDCQNFYICIGRSAPIFGKCPNKTVFSEISKQCTKNLSHCIRNNQFKCISTGRYIDIFSDQFYYICAKKKEGYIRFKLQCQKGYHLDKTELKCILDSINVSMSNEDSSKTDSEKSTIESKSKEDKDSKNQTKYFECEKEGKFVYPDDCRKYYQCTKCGISEFRRKIKKCDSDEVFNHEKRKCVDDDSYECKD
ncbi:putative mediator of RNA polymerase II transcription subunit 26 isoform X2 [Maniola jurtina]|uniref:putative mediator of RNA polymerase II transcription subunit 26 isoform X2 n=1 Tax=Maniola jurtina TaxID=191418 RepID=UPI001E687897|nr:putative mediator of RNA polymerase II transcription subunit 26 isoform X2 [Maniola jurtina]